MADSPCMKNRSLKAGGRLNRWSFKAGFTVPHFEVQWHLAIMHPQWKCKKAHTKQSTFLLLSKTQFSSLVEAFPRANSSDATFSCCFAAILVHANALLRKTLLSPECRSSFASRMVKSPLGALWTWKRTAAQEQCVMTSREPVSWVWIPKKWEIKIFLRWIFGQDVRYRALEKKKKNKKEKN